MVTTRPPLTERIRRSSNSVAAADLAPQDSLDAHTGALLRRRYSGDFSLGGYDF